MANGGAWAHVLLPRRSCNGPVTSEMATEEDANAAIDQINGQEVDGRPLRVDFATSSR